VILAGGGSRRMGGRPKSLLPLAGQTLLQHVIERVRPQVGKLLLSVRRPSDELAAFGLPMVPDPQPGAGPLAALLAVLGELEEGQDWLLLVPCDAPFLPRSLAANLLSRALESGLPGAVVRYRDQLQPTFSLWNRSLLPRLEQAVTDEDMRGFKQFLGVSQLAVVDWPASEPPPFFNINDAAALRQAERLLTPQQGKRLSCSA
jgi:molybdopterin-guanine dinucleotide biosynthesis protein A